eukprot:jgi/Mesvir1/14462/Mv05173-RA.1
MDAGTMSSESGYATAMDIGEHASERSSSARCLEDMLHEAQAHAKPQRQTTSRRQQRGASGAAPTKGPMPAPAGGGNLLQPPGGNAVVPSVQDSLRRLTFTSPMREGIASAHAAGSSNGNGHEGHPGAAHDTRHAGNSTPTTLGGNTARAEDDSCMLGVVMQVGSKRPAPEASARAQEPDGPSCVKYLPKGFGQGKRCKINRPQF